MKRTGTTRSTWRSSLWLASVLFVLVTALSALPLVRTLQLRLADTYFQLAGKPSQPSPVVLVLIDDESLRDYGRWPWSRTLLAQLTAALDHAGASVIGLDILLSEPQSAEADSALANALRASGRAVVVDKIGSYADGPHWIEPLPLFSSAATVGHSLAVLDLDGVCRRFPARELTPDGSRWAFAVEVVRRIEPGLARAYLARYGVPASDTAGPVIIAKPVLVPIAFRQPQFAVLSASDVLRGKNLELLRGHPVLVGFGPAEISDRVNTPLSSQLPSPGVEVHAQILDSILGGRMVCESPLWTGSVLLAGFCVAVIVFFRRFRGWRAVTMLGLVAVIVYAAALLVFIAGSRLINAGPLLLALVLAPMLAYTADFLEVERSLTRQLRELRRWMAVRRPEIFRRNAGDLSWRLEVLQELQAELGSLFELHETLVQTTHDLVVIFDAAGEMLVQNARFAAFWAAQTDARVTCDRLFTELQPSDDAPLLTRGRNVEGEASLRGELYAVRAVPLPPTTLAPAGGTIVTLTNLRARVERDHARAEALGFITHELRTPLVAIQGFAEFMMQFPESPACARAPETIFRESKRLLALINGYLDVLRLDAGARAVRSEPLNLPELVSQVFDILQPLAAAVNMRLRVAGDELPPVYGDGALLSGAILNLVSNALKYGQPDSDVRVTYGDAQDEVVLRVENQGDPIPASDITRLFDSFYRSPVVEGKSPGWGLGLAFVRRIAEKHGGYVRARSDSSGTVFEIHLPAQTGAVLAKRTGT